MPLLPLAVAAASLGALDAPRGVRETAHEVEVDVEPPLASFTVTISLANASGRDAEAVLRLPLPSGAAVSSLEVERDTRWEPALSRSAAEARSAYADLVHPRSGAVRPVAAASLVPDGQGAARIQVFPVPAGKTVRVRIRAVSPLSYSGGAYRFVYPGRRGDRLAPATVALRGASALRAARASSAVDLVLGGGSEPFSVHAAGARGAGVWISAERASEPAAAVDVVLVVDRSASMQDGPRRAAADDVLARFLDALPERSRVAAVTFGRDVGDRIPAGEARALRRLLDPDPRWEAPPSGSDLGPALAAAAGLFPPDDGRARHVVILTDGRLDGTAQDSPWPDQDGGLPAGVQVSALVVAQCDETRLLGALVGRRDGAMVCGLDRATTGDLDRAVRAVVGTGERLQVTAGRTRLAANVRAGEQASLFAPVRGRSLPSEVVVVRADGTPVRAAVREVALAGALASPGSFVWVDGQDAFARARLSTGRMPAGEPSGSGLRERPSPAARPSVLGPETLHRVLQRSYLPAVRGCFLRHAPRTREPVALVIEGRVEEAEAFALSVRGATGDLERCLADRAQTVLYPWSPGAVRFRWPITYRPAADDERPGGSGPPAPR